MRGAGELLRIPTIDIAEVGAGGGSIAWLDAGGRAAGRAAQRGRRRRARPATGAAASEPTVTDANVVLGYMPAGAGRGRADHDLARSSPSRRCAASPSRSG